MKVKEAFFKDLYQKYSREEISFSRMCELINEEYAQQLPSQQRIIEVVNRIYGNWADDYNTHIKQTLGEAVASELSADAEVPTGDILHDRCGICGNDNKKELHCPECGNNFPYFEPKPDADVRNEPKDPKERR